jgi:hypothetical protein
MKYGVYKQNDNARWELILTCSTISEAQDIADLRERVTGIKHHSLPIEG